MADLQTAWNTVNEMVRHIPPGTVESILGASIISPVVQFIKLWWERNGTRKFRSWFAWLFIAISSLLVVFSEFIFTYDGSDAGVIWLRTMMMGFMTQPVYFLLIKPVYLGLTKVFTDVTEHEEEVHSAKVPPEGIPIEGVQPVVRDLL